MRLRDVAILFCACFAFAGCTSSAGLDDLAPRPSNEVTSSIKPQAPLASEPQAQLASQVAEPVGAMAEQDQELPDAQVSEAVAYAEPSDPPATALLLPETSAPPPQAVALVAPARPRAGQKAIMGAIQPRRFRDAKPINFGKSSPKHLPVHGVDVSRWQGDIDWVKLRSQGANFAYIKATDGGDHLDPMFRKNWRGAHEAGLKRGAYHFFYWCRTAGEQADWFIRNVPRVEGALPPVIDVEWNGESSCKRRPSPARVVEKMQVFMDKLEAHYGQRPIIYTAPDFYRDNLKGAFPNHPFWLRAVAQHPSKVYPGRKWVFWQYSGSGLSHGVSGRIDLNAFNGSEREWRAWAGGQSLVADAD